MKSKREAININDFSNGLLTNPSQTIVNKEQLQNSPDCLNVYSEGPTLRKRLGITKINTVSAGTTGNGFYNWVINSSLQYLMGLFDSTLKQMTVSGTTWSGTWNSLSADSSNGTFFSNALMHFVTYQGTLIMTTEARDKPQRITSSDSSHKNIDYNGTGIAPFAKYPQVWKEHVWLLNIGGNGQLTEDCVSLANWTTLDVSTGATTTTAFNGQQTFRFHGGAGASSDAHIKRTVTGMTSNYSAEIRTYFATLGAITSGDYAYMDICNGSVRFRTRWSSDGLETFNGTTWLEVGVNTVSTGTWITWKYLITSSTATAAAVDVFKNGSAIGLQFSVANASTASNGQIDLAAAAGGSASRSDWYMDYLYINSIAAKTNYFRDGIFNSWVSTSQASYTDNVLPTQAYLQYKCNDNAGNSTVTDTGTGTNNGTSNNSVGTINTSTITVAGKVSNAFSLDSSAAQYIKANAATISAISTDAAGSFSLWIYPNVLGGSPVTISNSTGNSLFNINVNGDGTMSLNIQDASLNLYNINYVTSLATANWYHIALTQSGTTFSLYLNNSLITPSTFSGGTPGAWVSNMTSLDSLILGLAKQNSAIVNKFSGRVDDFRYYRSAITTSNISALYAEGNATEGNPVTVQEGTTIYTGTYSYRVNNDGQYAVISQSLPSSSSIAGVSCVYGAFVNATNLSTYKLRVNDGTTNFDSAVITANGTWQYQTLAFTPASNSTTIRAQVISLSSSTIFIDLVGIVLDSSGITQDFSDRLQRSVSGTYDTWTGGDSGTNDITTPGDVGLTGSFILQDRMYVTKSWNIYRITYTNSVPLLDIKQARSVVGTKSPRAIKNIDYGGQGELVIFLGTDRNIYLFDGFSSSPISDGVQLNNNIAAVYTNNINAQALDKVFAVNHSDLGWYEIFLPIGDATVPNYSLMYNYRTKSFWPFSNRSFLSGGVTDDGSGQRVIMVNGATNGFTYQLNSGYSDDGTAINSYWTSFKLGEDYILNKIDEFRLGTDSVNATPSFGWRCNYETSYVTKILKANTNKHDFSPERIDNLIQFKISDNSTSPSFKIWHVKALERAIGIGG